MNFLTFVILIVCFASIALADDFKTVNGKEYKDATVSRVEADGIVLRTKSGITKVYFVELPKEVQERFHYNPPQAATSRPTPPGTSATSTNIYGLSPTTLGLKDEILNALKMTDNLDALYKRGCTSAEFIAAATPTEGVFMNLQKKLPKGDPGRDLLANTFEGYQQAAIAMVAAERSKDRHLVDVAIAVAGMRKGLLTKVLEGNMTESEKQLYQVWLQGHP